MYKPEGQIKSDRKYTAGDLVAALKNGTILEGKVKLCTADHTLIVDLGCGVGEIEKSEAVYPLFDAKAKDIAIISRVGKTVCFKVKSVDEASDGSIRASLSRKDAQKECYENYISTLECGDIIGARITHIEPFGCFADIGCGIVSLLPIDCISVSRIETPYQRFYVGQDIFCAVREISGQNGRILLTHKELLGSWEENAALFEVGQTACGIIRSVEDYGIFVELAPNLAGLSEPFFGAKPGMNATVFIKNIIPERMKIKLVIIDAGGVAEPSENMRYYIPESKHIDHWRYAPTCCNKGAETFFDMPRTFI